MKKISRSFSFLKRRIYRYLVFFKPLFYIFCLLIFLGLLYFLVLIFTKVIPEKLKSTKLAISFFQNPVAHLQSYGGRTNLLLLGISGGEHEGADLTDTMIFFSVRLKDADTVALSIPRDIWIDSMKAKVNTAYHYGEAKEKNGGFFLSSDAVYQITGQPVHYTFLLDFQGFVKIIDLLGGIEVEVERSFDDDRYPIAGKENDPCNGDPEYECRFQHLHFDAGIQKMDGERALKFVRSRYAEGEEGGDFARNLRQQKIMMAMAKKIFSTKTLLDIKKLENIKETLSQNFIVYPVLSEEEIGSFLSLFLRFVKAKKPLRILELDLGTSEKPGFLKETQGEEYEGHQVLLPASGDWGEFQKHLKGKIEKGD